MTLSLYVPGRTVVHRAPAGLALGLLAVLGVWVFAVPTVAATGAALAVVLVVGLGVARLPVAVLLRQAWLLRWWLVALVGVNLLLTDAGTAALAVLRLLALVVGATVVTSTCRVSELVAVVQWLCAPLRVFGVRPARIGLVLAMTLRFIPVVAERAARIREAQAARGGTVRGVRAVVGTVVPLLVQVLVLAHTLAEALDARGADSTGVDA